MGYLKLLTSAKKQWLVGRAEGPELAKSQMRTKYSRSGSVTNNSEASRKIRFLFAGHVSPNRGRFWR
jgi:hypothetical protein